MFETLAPGAALLFLDQCGKRMAQRAPARRISSRLLVLRYVPNRGYFAGRNLGPLVLALVWCSAAVSAIVLRHWGTWFQSRMAMAGLGLALAGAASNLWDIWRCACIVDFIDLRWWPVFNLADVGIVVGLLLAFFR